ncbi:MAG: UDP-N-acetylmuramoyl-L-alanine--D-glutamate ligase [Alphaproteobacteria bacterium]|jgi:UDP-N-acetylmuramoylalanine--D-glutamate ligase|nr:UDP-N-acetylmuramoyl-L-alanine--D-glutamate ligase [Alphaproteobacteria bacterium]MDP6591130.1 UDP-N-acetylmuramoyl-L-alanine--D-glutamate ligase [Alphaproteobacteria bacterium]MDP6817909.1 UDP-N-acetylmuramoyl-L-alanine--D-glutamate ligase [Alphaproteobacteria bacterium]
MIVGTSRFAGTVVVLGLARSGLSAARALMASGNTVLAWDDTPERVKTAARAGIPVHSGADFDWRRVAALVPSPGIPLDHPTIVSARAARIEILGDVELLGRAMAERKFVGITGTNGKSTTTALIGHILEHDRQTVQVGGNLGTPALSLEALWADGTYVLEMSSFQLDLTREMSFDIAVLLNIAPDHLDRHGSMNAYVAAKRKIFRSGRLKTAVVGIDGPDSLRIYNELRLRDGLDVVPVTTGRRLLDGIAVNGGLLEDRGRAICDLAAATALPGRHNWQNAAAAYGAARALGVNAETIARALLNFPGLAHRMEHIAAIDGVQFINDSKATNGDAAARALACYNPIYWIAGGRAKSNGLSALRPYFQRISHAFLIGEAEQTFAAELDGRVDHSLCQTLDSALDAAAAQARADGRPGAVVLFSPACASFDQYADFEARGEAFRELVYELERRQSEQARRAWAG